MRKVFLFLSICLFLSCTTEEYESGDGEMSYLRADFVMAYAGADKSIVSAVTDEGEQLTWSKGFAPKWAEKADTTYRALLYYNKVEGKVDPVSIVSVSVPRVRKMSEVKDKVYTDPVVFESAWKSANNSFINLGLQLKTLRLYHHQNDVPEYYSANLYVSIPFDRLPCDIQKGDEVSITINTYKGEVKKGFVY